MKIEEAFYPSIIVAIGYTQTWSIALQYGTHHYGGLYNISLEVEALMQNTISTNFNIQRQNPKKP